MEQINQNNQSNQEIENSDFRLTKHSVEYLKSSASWIRFYSIMGFIVCGLLIIGAIIDLLPSSMPNIPVTRSMSIMWVVGAILVFFPSKYLYKYSDKIRCFLETNDNDLIERALLLQNKYWTFISIITIIGLSITVISLLAFVLGNMV